jgi:cytochrome bd-type quinol oxidase subunit 2
MIAWMIRWTMFTHQGEPFQLPMMIMTAFVVFAGSGAIVFFVRHWDKARKPLAVMGLGVLLILALVGLGLAT